MKERPIIFNAAAVKAILSGSKSMTRRPMKPQPCDETTHIVQCDDGVWSNARRYLDGEIEASDIMDTWHQRSPFGQPGDRLWVRETFGHFQSDPKFGAKYRADYENDEESGVICWTPSIHMSRRASRITLEIVSVKVERVSEISEEDAKAEDAPYFRDVWNSIYGKTYPWESSPFVWVYTFGKFNAAERQMEEEKK